MRRLFIVMLLAFASLARAQETLWIERTDYQLDSVNDFNQTWSNYLAFIQPGYSNRVDAVGVTNQPAGTTYIVTNGTDRWLLVGTNDGGSGASTPQGPWTNWPNASTFGVSNAGPYKLASSNLIIFMVGSNICSIQGTASEPTNIAWNGNSLWSPAGTSIGPYVSPVSNNTYDAGTTQVMDKAQVRSQLQVGLRQAAYRSSTPTNTLILAGDGATSGGGNLMFVHDTFTGSLLGGAKFLGIGNDAYGVIGSYLSSTFGILAMFGEGNQANYPGMVIGGMSQATSLSAGGAPLFFMAFRQSGGGLPVDIAPTEEFANFGQYRDGAAGWSTNRIITIYGDGSLFIRGGTNQVSGQLRVGKNSLNTAQNGSAVLAGDYNTSTGSYSVVGGGYQNIAAQSYSTVPGGRSNQAHGAYSYAHGYRAKAVHNSSWVWSDDQGSDFSSTATNQFLVRASGGVWANDDGTLKLVTGYRFVTNVDPKVFTPAFQGSQMFDVGSNRSYLAVGTTTNDWRISAAWAAAP